MTSEQLTLIFVNAKPNAIELFTPYIIDTFQKYGMITPLRQAHFLAQIGHESGELKYVREIWGPTKAQARYEGRLDLGNTEPGDGKFFMGRGLIQITGRNNYASISKTFFNNPDQLLQNPQLLETPRYAALSAGWFWNSRKLNILADKDDIKAITKRINGGLNGIIDRERILTIAKQVLKITL